MQILDHGIDNGTPFIAMELLNGESLAERLETAGTLSPSQTGRLLGHVGRALAHEHEHGIVHRDTKPENVFLVREDDDESAKCSILALHASAVGYRKSVASRFKQAQS